jgi:uncharacterized membrane protein YeaQ/YmgE (transglycosylase-associated protein family)
LPPQRGYGWEFSQRRSRGQSRCLNSSGSGRTEPGGCIGTTAVGILGALLGGFLASALDIGELDEFFDLGTWLIAIGGSVLLLLIIRAVAR